ALCVRANLRPDTTLSLSNREVDSDKRQGPGEVQWRAAHVMMARPVTVRSDRRRVIKKRHLVAWLDLNPLHCQAVNLTPQLRRACLDTHLASNAEEAVL